MGPEGVKGAWKFSLCQWGKRFLLQNSSGCSAQLNACGVSVDKMFNLSDPEGAQLYSAVNKKNEYGLPKIAFQSRPWQELIFNITRVMCCTFHFDFSQHFPLWSIIRY